MRITLAGPLAVHRGGVGLGPTDFPGRQGRITFAYLALAGRAVDRDELADVLWPRDLPRSWARDLSAVVSKIKSVLLPLTGTPAVKGGGRWYELALPPGSEIDVVRASRQVEEAEAAHRAGDATTALAAAGAAAAVLGARFLAGDECAWIDERRAAQHELLLRALSVRACVLGGRQDPAALGAARALVQLDPTREESHLLVVRAHLAAGERAEALNAYEGLRRMLAEEFGLAPSDRAEALARTALDPGATTGTGGIDPVEVAFPNAFERSRRSPLLGRDRELAQLVEQLSPGGAGVRAALVTGEAGIGKTRLVAELAQRLHAQGPAVLLGTCEPGAGESYGPWVEAIARAARAGGDTPLHRALALLRPEPAAVAAPGREPPTRVARFQAFARELRSLAAARPTVFVFEDVQWMDRDSRDLLGTVLAEVAGLGVVLTARDDELGPGLGPALTALRRDDALTVVRLGGLAPEAVRGLVHTLTGGRAVGEELTDAIHRATAGNPLYARELTRHLEYVGGLDGDTAPADLLRVAGLPDGLAELIDANVARAGPHVRSVLEAAAVIGTTFDVDVLRHACDLPDDDVDATLQRARRAHLVVPVGGTPPRARFEHPLVREVLVHALGDARRARLHRRVADAIEATDRAGPDGNIAELAHHLVAAAGIDVAPDALTFAQRAGERALAVHAHGEATKWFERSVALARRDPSRREGLARALASLGDARNRLGDVTGAREALTEAAEIARATGDGELVAVVTLLVSGLLLDEGFEGATVDTALVGMLEGAMETLAVDTPLRARLGARLAMELHFSGDRSRCERVALAAEAEARASGDLHAVASALAARHYTMYGTPDVGARIAVLQELRSLGVSTRPDPRWARDHLEAGDLDAFDDATARFARQLEGESIASDRYYPAIWSAVRAILVGDLDEGEELAARAARIGRECGRGPAAVGAVHAAQVFAIELFRGGLDRLGEAIDAYAAAAPARPVWGAAAAFLRTETGDPDGAAARLGALRARGFASLPSTVDLPVTLALLAWVCARVGTEDDARELAALLRPYGGLALVLGATAPAVCAGPAAYPLAVLHRATGDDDAADRWFRLAERTARRMHSAPWLERIRRDPARRRGARPAGPPPAARR